MKESELLRKQADIMDMAEKYGIDDLRRLVRVRDVEYADFLEGAMWIELKDWKFHKFAIGVVEGRPVFEGDELWNVPNKFKFIAAIANNQGGVDCIWSKDIGGRGSIGGSVSDLSWNQPKPATVMIGDVECNLPDSMNNLERYAILQIGSTQFYYKSEADRDNTEIAIVKILRGKH